MSANRDFVRFADSEWNMLNHINFITTNLFFDILSKLIDIFRNSEKCNYDEVKVITSTVKVIHQDGVEATGKVFLFIQ